MSSVRAEFGRLASRLRGRLILPTEAGFAAIGKWFIGQFTEIVPQAVVRCGDASDVATALAFARQTGMPFALRSGGNSLAEYSTTDGLLIDLGRLDSVKVSPDRSLVTVGPGTRIGPMAATLAAQ